MTKSVVPDFSVFSRNLKDLADHLKHRFHASNLWHTESSKHMKSNLLWTKFQSLDSGFSEWFSSVHMHSIHDS